ncbi:cytochrome P450 [Streptomyces sp. NPDC089919]|uniref:cytochrome P450 n=1 Tax=Streptomyces sp. NPDC089919 TaxID=3155188 RepID=UPI0034377D1A
MTTPIAAVRAQDPYPYYASLVADRPFAYDATLNAWVAADATAVQAVLAAPQLRVRPTSEPVPTGIKGTAAGDVFADLVRMTDGPDHHRLKSLVARTLAAADLTEAAATATTHTQKALAEAGGPIPYDDLMFAVPARTVAGLLGLTDGADETAARLIADFVQCIPAGATEAQYGAAARAAETLRDLLAPGLEAGAHGLLADLLAAARQDDRQDDRPDTAPLLANALGFLSQTYDATAGLIGNTLLALARGAELPGTPAAVDALVREVVRYDAPIQNTRRFAAEPFGHAGATVAPGEQVLVLLAAANRDPAVNPDPHALLPGRVNPAVFTFGAAAHRCPGEELAAAVAGAVVGALLAAGWDPAALPAAPAYRPLANARIPVL